MDSKILTRKAPSPFKTSVTIYQSTRCNDPEDLNLNKTYMFQSLEVEKLGNSVSVLGHLLTSDYLEKSKTYVENALEIKCVLRF